MWHLKYLAMFIWGNTLSSIPSHILEAFHNQGASAQYVGIVLSSLSLLSKIENMIS